MPALPSMIGTSSAETSTNALSIPSPAKADMRCSTVDTRAPFFSITVAITVLVTLSAWAGIAGLPGRSERQKTMPLSIGAGRNTIVTLLPVCRPTPVARTVVLRVRCRIMGLAYGLSVAQANLFNSIMLLDSKPAMKSGSGQRTR